MNLIFLPLLFHGLCSLQSVPENYEPFPSTQRHALLSNHLLLPHVLRYLLKHSNKQAELIPMFFLLLFSFRQFFPDEALFRLKFEQDNASDLIPSMQLLLRLQMLPAICRLLIRRQKVFV